MSATNIAQLSAGEKTSLAYSYAALILADIKKDITASALDAIVKASGNATDKSWATLLEKSFSSRKIDDLLVLGGGASSGAAQTSSQPAAPSGGAAKKEEPKKEAPKEEEEGDFDMGDLFG